MGPSNGGNDPPRTTWGRPPGTASAAVIAGIYYGVSPLRGTADPPPYAEQGDHRTAFQVGYLLAWGAKTAALAYLVLADAPVGVIAGAVIAAILDIGVRLLRLAGFA